MNLTFRTIKGIVRSLTMNLAVWFLTTLITVSSVGGQQRVPPGVPPQQYGQHQQGGIPQQGGVPQQGGIPQQVNVQHQQIPVQQVPVQQVPVQQVPVQQQIPVQQQQQIPVQQTHHGHHPQQGQILNAANIAHEKQHIQEHMEVPIDTSKMSDQELQFHYFKMHDADNNNKLDGCELIKSLIHWHDQGDGIKPEAIIYTDKDLEHMIDALLREHDPNGDGYIDYGEYKYAQEKAVRSSS